MKKWILILFAIPFCLSSCISENRKLEKLAQNYENPAFINFEIDSKHLITEVEIDGVKVGDSYKTHRKKLKKSDNQSIDTDFTNFDLFNSEAEKIGVVTIANFSKTIEIIQITSSTYKTAKGIGVGSTFKEAKQKYPYSETHGNKLENRTILMAGDYNFLLGNIGTNSYDIDESDIEPTRTIEKIIIRK